MEAHDGWRAGAGGAGAGADNATAGSQAERERVRVEFYATYDVMTGVRIAATLGGFFALMVFLIVYKSRSKSVKALNDPKIVEMAEAAVAEEEAEEEERRLSAALSEALSERRRASSSGGRAPRRASSAACSSSASEYLERRRARAPLASESAAASFAVECELGSGADSVFARSDAAPSTDDEVEQFSTDSGEGAELAARPAPRRARAPPPTTSETLF